MKIGVTLNLVGKGLFSNGVNQNALYLTKLLNNCGYSTHLIYAADDNQIEITKEILNKENIECIDLNKSFELHYDIIITVGLQISKKDWDRYKSKNNNIKLVSYKCGNEFFFEIESIIFDKDVERYTWEFPPQPDQIWSIPQMEKTNLDYYSFATGQKKSTVVPFIWDPMSIEYHNSTIGGSTYTGNKISRIGIFEPNASFMKNSIIPLMSVEDYYRKNKSNVEILRIFSGLKIKENKRFSNIINSFELFKDTKISMEARHNTISMLNEHIDLIVSWQMENNLNYLYLDAAWFGYPVIHNANLCSDIGYYYESNNIYEASNIIKKVINEHPSDKEYLNRNRELIYRYLPENKTIQNQYIKLIDDLMSNNFKKYKYEWKTNTIKEI